MNLGTFFILSVLGLSSFLQFATLILKELNASSHKFPTHFEDCSNEIEAYWFDEYPKHCIPPPMDHSAYFAPRGSAPPAICIFVNNLPLNIKIKTKNGEHSCSYL